MSEDTSRCRFVGQGDGFYFEKGGKRYEDPVDLKEALLADTAEQAKHLPFRTPWSDVFSQAITQGDDVHHIILIDAGWLHPGHRQARVRTHLPGV